MTAEPDATVESSDGAPLGVSAPPPRSLPGAFLLTAVTGALLALVPLWLGDSRLMGWPWTPSSSGPTPSPST